MLATTWSAVWDGEKPSLVRVEVLVSPGLPSFSIVGAAEAACREARDRVRAAVLSSGLAWPMRRISAGLAPSWIAKRGSSTDLALGVAVLAAAGVVPGSGLDELCFIGELGLDGRVRAVPGGPALASVAGCRRVVVAPEAGALSALVCDGSVAGVRTLAQAVRCLDGQEPWPDVAAPMPVAEPAADVEGCLVQAGLVWEDWAPGLAVAAAGGHAALVRAPSGAGRSVTRALWALLPDLDRSAARSVVLARGGGGTRSADGTGLWRPPLVVLGAGATPGAGRRDAVARAVLRAQHGLLVVDLQAAPGLGPVRELGLALARRSAGSEVASLPGAREPDDSDGWLGGSSAQLVVLDHEEPASTSPRPVAELVRSHVEVGLVRGVGGWPGWPGPSPACGLSGRVREARRRALERWGLPASQVPPSILEMDVPLGSLERAQLAAFVEQGGGDTASHWTIRRVARTVADLAGEAAVASEHLERAAELWAAGRSRCR